MAYRVRISARAKRDLGRILDRLIKEGAGEAGVRWWLALKAAASSLEYNPRRCALAPEAELSHSEIRHLLYGTKPHVYRLLFTIDDDVVTVFHIRHGRRLPMELQ